LMMTPQKEKKRTQRNPFVERVFKDKKNKKKGEKS